MVFNQAMDERTGHHADPKTTDLREQLVHRIYAMVDQSDTWPATLSLLDALCRCSEPGGDSDAIDSLIPHIDRANLLIAEMERLKLSHQQSEAILERIPIGIAIITPRCGVISANRRAEVLLDGINARSSRGRIRIPEKCDDDEFRKAVAELCADRCQGKALRCGHLNLWLCRHDRDPERLLLFLSDHTSRHRISVAQLQRIYGLTKKEAAVASELCNGISDLESAAVALDISRGTVRSHLKRVFAKTDTGSQAELMKMLMLNPALSLGEELELQGGTQLLHQTIRLLSARTISYAEYGDAGGTPVLFCHAVTGCRLLIPDDRGLLRRNGIRLIVPDRAGFGYSDVTSGTDPFRQWIEDAKLLLRQLGIDRCALIGHSGGAPFAFEMAATCPEMIERLLLISAIAPLSNPEDMKLFLPLHRMGNYLCRSKPEIARSFIRLALKKGAENPDSYFYQMFEHMPDIDRDMFSRNGFQQRLIEGFSESRRQGENHMVDELIHISRNWHVEPEQIRCPVHLWHGADDPVAPAALTRKLAGQLSGLESERWVENSGHYLLYSHWQSMVPEIAATLTR